MSDLLQYPWIKPPHATRTHRRLYSLFVANDLPPPESMLESGSVALQLNVLRQSNALATTVSETLQTPESDSLVMLNVPELALTRDAGVIIGRDGWVSPAVAGIIDALKAICAAETASRKRKP
jgi:LysR family transcriptional regulator of gallate degradation